MDDPIQGAAVVELGLNPSSYADYSCYFSEFLIQKIRNTVRKPASPNSPAVEDKAASKAAVVTASFLAGPHDPSSPWAIMNTASDLPSGELYFRVRYASGPVSASNPMFTGYIVVNQLGIGAAARATRRQSVTFPARAVSDPITSD